MQVVLNRRDKEQLVIKLHQEGKTIREIASLRICHLRILERSYERIDGRDNDDRVEAKKISKTSPEKHKALFLFSNGKKPIDVAIELDLSASEVHNMLEEYWALNDLHELALVYNEIKAYLPSFLKLFHCLKERRMLDEKHIFKFLKYANYDLSDLENRVQGLSNEIIKLEGQKRNSMNKVILWNAQLSDLSKAIDIKNQQLKRMGK